MMGPTKKKCLSVWDRHFLALLGADLSSQGTPFYKYFWLETVLFNFGANIDQMPLIGDGLTFIPTF